MKKIIQIYKNLQGPWSSKVKFVSLSQLLGAPSLGPKDSGLFTVPGFIVSPVSIKKKKKDGRKKKYRGRERRSRTRKQEREEEGAKRKKK